MFWGVMEKDEIVKLFIYSQITDTEHKQLIISLELKNRENYNKMESKIDLHENENIKE